jgi:hypothetical protein
MTTVRYVNLSDEAREFVKENVMHVMEAGAIIVRDEIVQYMLDSSPSGELYEIPGTVAEYRASAPGQPPAIREGRYINSWHWTPAVVEDDQVVAFAFTDLMVGNWVLGDLLEYGTSHMEPRPHVVPALPIAAAKLEQFIEGSI